MINPDIEKTDVFKALDYIDEKGVPKHRKSTKYNLIHNEKSYPPKYVISIANKFATGEELDTEKFNGGKETNNFLSKLGFIIQGKTPLKDIIQLVNYTDYKLHFATGEKDKKEALTALENGTFDDFQNQQSKLNFSRKYILSLACIGEGEWVFAGIYENLGHEIHPTDTQYKFRYKTILTEQHQEYIGKLIVKYDKNFRQSYPYLEKYIEDIFVLKMLNNSLFDAQSTQNKDKQASRLDYYQRAYSITKKYIDENIDLSLKEAKQLIAGNGNYNTANGFTDISTYR